MSFQAWMAKGNVRASTARHYAGAIYGVLSQTPLGPVPTEADIEAFDRFAEALRARVDFQTLNETGHRMYSSALAMYRRYVAFLADGVPLEVEDCKAVAEDADLTATERTVLVQARLGQGMYRERLIRLWQGRCSVTGYADTRVLIASHIKPWYRATNEERVNPMNGLLLTPNLDKVFDLGLITFDPAAKGQIVFSPCLTAPAGLGLTDSMRLTQCGEETAKFLQFHRKNVFLAPSFST